MSEEDRWRKEEIWETLSVAENREELQKEITIIDKLIERAKTIIQNEEEKKLKEFKNSLHKLAEKYPDPKDKKAWCLQNHGYTESFFKKAFLKAKGKLRVRKDGFLAIDSVPFGIRSIADEDSFKKSFGDLLKKYPKATFDKEMAFKNQDAEFICFGHPLFEGMMNFIDQKYSDTLLTGATFFDPDGFLDGYIIFYEGEIKDGTGTVAGKRLFSFYVQDQKIIPFPASIIWDLAEAKNNSQEFADLPAQGAQAGIEKLKNKTSVKAIEDLEEYKSELLTERERQAEIKQKYGFKSLEYLIVNLDGDLIELYDRKECGENVDLAIRNKEERKTGYEKSLEELKIQIEKEKSMTMSMPRFKGIIRVLPQTTVDREMRNDPEVELIGMQIAMEYEKKNNREPEDVSEQNPAENLKAEEKVEVVRYFVQFKEIKEKNIETVDNIRS